VLGVGFGRRDGKLVVPFDVGAAEGRNDTEGRNDVMALTLGLLILVLFWTFFVPFFLLEAPPAFPNTGGRQADPLDPLLPLFPFPLFLLGLEPLLVVLPEEYPPLPLSSQYVVLMSLRALCMSLLNTLLLVPWLAMYFCTV
jgi:hypothetical protein